MLKIEHYLKIEAFRDWIASIGWKPESIVEIQYDRESFPDGGFDGLDGRKWRKVRPSDFATIKVKRNNEMQESRFDVSQKQWLRVA